MKLSYIALVTFSQLPLFLDYVLHNFDCFTFIRSHQRCSVKEGVPKNFANFTGKHLCESVFSIKFQACNKTYFEERLPSIAFALFPL